MRTAVPGVVAGSGMVAPGWALRIRRPAGTPTSEGGAWFDDSRLDPASDKLVLMHIKHWGRFVLPEQGLWRKAVLKEAEKQLQAQDQAGLTGSARIEWVVSTDKAAEKISQLLARQPDDRYSQIDIVVVPKK